MRLSALKHLIEATQALSHPERILVLGKTRTRNFSNTNITRALTELRHSFPPPTHDGGTLPPLQGLKSF